MKATKIYLAFLALGMLTVTCEVERDVYSNEDGRFVRFFLQVKSDGQLANPYQLNPGADIATLFNNKSVQTLAVPVVLTSEPLTGEVTVDFIVETTGDFEAFTVTPADGHLSFSGTKLSDTIYIDFYDRWDESATNQIKLKLVDVSDETIAIGNPGNLVKNDELTINLAPLTLKYYFQQETMIEISGTSGEVISFIVQFPDGLFPGDLEGIEIIAEESSEFEYSLERLPAADDDMAVVYNLTLGENLDEFAYKAVFTLNQLENYTIAGNTKITISKPELVYRENSVNTAALFYNLSDPYHRTYGENWMDYNKDGVCDWTGFSAFTFPVVVSSTHPNAVLYDDKGTADSSDDIYHHAFRIGFNSPNIGNTTNSFNLKRWFSNYSTNASVSPGFNVTQALEFYPTDGTSTTGGKVKIISQDLVIGASSGGNVHTIAIEGEGTYNMISDGVFEIILELRATNQALFGGTRVSYYRIYNTDTYADPPALTEGCFMPMEL